MTAATGSVLTGLGVAALTLLGWVALNFFGNPILTLREKRRKALAGYGKSRLRGEANQDIGYCWPEAALCLVPMKLTRDFFRNLLEAAERYAYVGLHGSLSDEYRTGALAALHDAGNSLRAYMRERSLATRIYCGVLRYDLDCAARALLALGQAARGEYRIDETWCRLTLHVLFVALGSTYNLSAVEIAAARTEMKKPKVLPQDGKSAADTARGALHDPPPCLSALPIRHINQACNPADQGVLIAGQHAIGIGHLPQHLDDANTFFGAEILDHNLGEMKQVCRLDCTLFRCLDEAGYLAPLQAEAQCQRALDDALFTILDPVVATRNFDEQHGKSKSGIVPFTGSMGIIDPGQNVKQSVEHVRSVNDL